MVAEAYPEKKDYTSSNYGEGLRAEPAVFDRTPITDNQRFVPVLINSEATSDDSMASQRQYPLARLPSLPYDNPEERNYGSSLRGMAPIPVDEIGSYLRSRN